MLVRELLHGYQKRLIKQAESIPHIGLFMEPGLGKTVTALTIIAEQFEGRTLIVAPKKVAESVWAQEAARWWHLSYLTINKCLGTPKERLRALETGSDAVVVNLENLVWLLEQGHRFENLVIDESSRFKDPSTKRFKAIKKQLKYYRRRIILTGTPSPQGVADLWAQVGILDLGVRLETSLTKFRDKYMVPDQINRHTRVVYSWKIKDNATDVSIKSKISDICFSLKAEDYLTLPPLTKLYHRIDIEPAVRKKYDKLKQDAVVEINRTPITAVSAAALSNKLLQFTSGAVYDENKDWHPVHDAKLDFLESIMEDSGSSPVLVFYHFKPSLVRLKERFPYAEVLDDSNQDRWRAGKIKMLLAHPQSGGIGLNLQCNVGETAQQVWFDLPWSSENYIQANARVYRQGQEKPVILHHLMVGKTIDDQVVNVLEGKINIQDALLESLKFV